MALLLSTAAALKALKRRRKRYSRLSLQLHYDLRRPTPSTANNYGIDRLLVHDSSRS